MFSISTSPLDSAALRARVLDPTCGALASFEGFVIDNEMLAAVQRVIRGIEVNDETLGLPVIAEVVEDPGHFLGHDHTIGAMERDYQYPDLGDRESPDAWAEQGATDMRERAAAKAREILDSPYPSYIPAEVDTRIRARFPIRLPEDRMRAG